MSAAILDALRDLVARCDGDEGVRADGSNIQTMRAHAVLDQIDALSQDEANQNIIDAGGF